MHSFRHAVRRHRVFFLAFVLLEVFFFIDGTTLIEASQHHKQQVRSEKLATARVLGVAPRQEWIEPPNWLEITGESLAAQTEEVLLSAQQTAQRWFRDWTAGSELGASASTTASVATGSRNVDAGVNVQQLPRRSRKSAAPPRLAPALAVGEGEHTLAPSLSSAERADLAGSGLASTADRLPVRQQKERKARQIDAGVLPLGKQLSSSLAPPSAPRSSLLSSSTGRHLGKAVAPEITALAASLGNSPGKIFRHVHDSIDYDPKWGADSPPLGTLWEARGTSWDQAWLLQELLLAAGVDARLEWGEVEISPELLMEVAGTDDPIRAGDLLTTAGLPVVLLIVGSQVASARMPHAWVKAHLDYIPNRGATAGTGDTWIRMDPSLKTFERNDGLRLDADVSYVLEDHLLSGTEQSPRAEYEAALLTYVADNNLGASSLEELKALRSLRAEDFPFVPGTLRAKILSAAGESETMPDAYQVQLEVKVRRQDGGPLLTWQAPLSSIYGGLFEIRWPGATSADQSTLDLYGGVYATPPYEVDLRPALTLDGVEVASGTSIGSAEDVELNLTATPPAGLDAGDGVPIVARWEMFAGEHGTISVDFGHAPQQLVDRYVAGALAATEPFEVEAWSLAAAAGTYLQTLGSDLEHLAALRWHQSFNFGTAVLAVQRGAVSTTSSGTPDTFSQGPLSINVGARTLGLYPVDGVLVSRVPTLELIGSQGSVREGEALESIFGGDHVTAVGFLTLAVREGQTLTRVDAGNVEAALATAILSSGAEAAVAFAVSQGAIAWIPETQLELNGWRTTGYIIEDPATGGGGYFVTFERLFTPLDGAVIFHSPADLDVITQPTDVIATIDVEGIETWTLSTRPTGGDAGGASGQVIATGTGPVENAVVGQFDPTLLLNGMHDLVLSGQDSAGQSVSGKITVLVEGEMKIGHFALSFVDLDVSLAGLDLQILRLYDSRDKAQGDFGIGWTLEVRQGDYVNNRPPGEGWQVVPSLLPCQVALETKPHLTTIRVSEEEVYYFRFKLGSLATQLGGCRARADFEFFDGPQPGASLEILGNDDVFYENGGNRVIDINTFELFEPRRVRLTTRDGRVFDFDLSAGVERLEDSNGNSLTIGDQGLTHSSGIGVSFERDAAGRITRITDPGGIDRNYTYDAAGNLVSYADPLDATTTFTYDDNHFMLEIEDPLGRTPIRNEYDDDGRLVRSIDAEGRVISMDHDLGTRTETITDRLGHVRTLEYDQRGNGVRETDENGAVTLFEFNDEDRLLSETDPLGRATTYVYDADGDLLSRTNAAGQTVSFTQNSLGQVLTRTDGNGNVSTSTYDSSGNLLGVTDALGQRRTYVYDGAGNLLSQTDGEGETTSYTYDAQGRRITETDPFGGVVSRAYDTHGNLLSEGKDRTQADGSVKAFTVDYDYDDANRVLAMNFSSGVRREFVYDAMGQVVERVGPGGHRSRGTYDAFGRLTMLEFPDSLIESRTYDAEGRLISTVDRAGHATTFTYDPAGRHLSTTHPDGSTESRVYDAAGQLTSWTDVRGHATDYEYDAVGRRSRITDSLGNSRTFAYDANGNTTASTDALGNTTTSTFDELNQLATTTFADGTARHFAYDSVGRRTGLTDEVGRETTFDLDAVGRLVGVTDALSQTTSFGYDEMGNRLSITDAEGQLTRFLYDEGGDVIGRRLPDGSEEGLTHSADGTVATRTDFQGRTTVFTHDAMQRLTRKTYPDGTFVAFTYTPTGRRATAQDSRGTTTYGYDNRDRLISQTYPDGRQLQYTYDAAGNRTSLTAKIGAQSFTTSYSYDALNRLQTVIADDGQVFDYSYDAAGNLLSLTYPNDTETTLTYDQRNRPTLLATTHGGDVLQSYAFTMAANGQRTRIDEADGTENHYEYDALGRLIGERVEDSTGAILRRQDNTYDAASNRTAVSLDEGAGATVANASFDTRDRLTSDGSETYSWNADGNLESRSGADDVSYRWDFEHRLTGATLADGTDVSMSYDVDGNRVRTVVTPPSGTPTAVNYLVDSDGLLSHAVAESSDTGIVLARYTRADRLLKAERPPSAEERFYHHDGLGSVRVLTDATGSVTDRYTYSAFGQLLEHDGSDANTYQFAGEPFDANLNLSYNRARWLDPQVGRFLSMDPFPGINKQPISLHRYLYGNADPVNMIDPTGESAGWAILIFVLLVVLVIMTMDYVTERNNRKIRQRQSAAARLRELTEFAENRDQTAMDAMRSIYPKCLDKKLEFCGPICAQEDGVTCQVGPPPAKLGGRSECRWENCSDPSTKTVGIYHCHGAPNGNPYSEYFSSPDTMAVTTNRPVYLVTPKGVMKKYVRYLGDIEIGRIGE